MRWCKNVSYSGIAVTVLEAYVKTQQPGRPVDLETPIPR